LIETRRKWIAAITLRGAQRAPRSWSVASELYEAPNLTMASNPNEPGVEGAAVESYS
jgi:hypothetical protein